MKIPLLYALHSGNLYGTERMALATAEALSDEYTPYLTAPRGPLVEEARRIGFAASSFDSTLQFAEIARSVLSQHRKVAFLATGVSQSLAMLACNVLYRRDLAHLHIVHGGTDERLSYGRKRWLNGQGVSFVAVSDFVRERLTAHSVRSKQISVIENFLPTSRRSEIKQRERFVRAGVRNVAIVSRLDAIKRIDVLLDALDLEPALGALQFRIFGTGELESSLKERARRSNPNVTFCGFSADIGQELAQSDLLLHLCPQEPFGLAILEAMAAQLPVLVPDQGGAGSLIEDEETGFRFAANDPAVLAEKLVSLSYAPASVLNAIASGASQALSGRFSVQSRSQDYRLLVRRNLQ